MAEKNLRFAMRLRELREESGVSMVELAKAIGVSDAAVCKWENGLAEPKASYIVRLAEYFDCTVDYILGVEGEYRASVGVTVAESDGTPVKATKPSVATLTHDEQALVSTYGKLSPAMKSVLKNTVDAIVAADKAKKRTD